jgi:cytochrome b involved in lipid metabolism
VAKHSTPGDCWIIINGNVYDVTQHLINHPGGANQIIPYCGQDATAAYDTKGGQGNPHSPLADSTLGPILVGALGSTVNPPSPGSSGNGTAIGGSTSPPPVTINGTVTLSLEEIAKHNSVSDCWIIISGSVYDVTAHLRNHPAGAGEITPYCGQDATTAYDTKGGRGTPHSSFADSTLGPILLGSVGQTVSGQVVQNAQNQTIPNLGGGEEEDD